MRYTISATVNYPEGEVETPVTNELTMEGVKAWVDGLLEVHFKATSLMVIIIPDKEPHENVI